MKWTTATGLFLVLAMGGAGAAFVLTRPPMPPARILAEVRIATARPFFDKASALRRLDRALAAARALDEPELEVEILQARSDIYRGLGDYSRARTDVEMLLSQYRVGDKVLELDLARLEALDGDLPAALERAHEMIDRDPGYAAAWALRAEFESASARAILDAAFEKIDAALTRTDAGEAKALLEELAARAPDDPAIAALRFRVVDLSAESRQVDILEALAGIEAPRAAFARARAGYATAIAIEPTPDRVVALAKLFVAAGQLDRAIALESAAQSIPTVADDADALGALLAHLEEAGRVSEAVRLLREWDWSKGGTLEFYRSSAVIFYRAGSLGSLRTLGGAMKNIGGVTGERWSYFFGQLRPITKARTHDGALSQDMKDDLQDATKKLRAFATDKDPEKSFEAVERTYAEPFPGAKIDAWFWIAEAYRHLDDPKQERAALRTGLALRPDHSADAWIHLASALKASTEIPWIEVESALTEALDLAPERTAELIDDWLEAGRKAIETQGLTIRGLIGEAARRGNAAPKLRSLGPATLTLIAMAHLEAGSGTSAQQAASSALRHHPNLVPPRDVVIGAKLKELNPYSTVERDIVSRIEVAGIDQKVETFLAQLQAGQLRGKELVRAIRAAPVRFGKPEVARWHQERGEPSLAGKVLAGMNPKNSPPSLRLLYARTLLDERQFDAAIAQLDEIASDERAAPEALLMKAKALVGAGRPQELATAVRAFTQRLPGPDKLLEMADFLMASDQAELALPIVDSLDRQPETRTPEFYRRRILVDILLASRRGPETAAESIARAQAYVRDGTPELASIVFAVARREWRDLPVLVRHLRESDFHPTPEEDVALSLLEERYEAGRRTAVAGLEASPRDPAWAFLTAAAAALVDSPIELPTWFGPRASADAELLFRGPDQRMAKDPRDALMLFLVSRQTEWSPWLLPRLNRLREDTGSTIWASWLALQIQEARADDAAVRSIINQLVETHRGFGPAHDMAVRLAEEAFPTEPLNPSIVRARRMRLESLGEALINDPVEIALAEAGKMYRNKRFKEAVKRIQPVLDAGGSDATEGRVILGTLMIQLKQPSFAAQYLFEAAMGDPGVYRDLVLDSLLFSIRYAIVNSESGAPQRGAIDRAKAIEMLDALVERYPLDPMVALTRLELFTTNAGERGAQARGVLERLHRQSGRRSLESLRPKSTRRWVEMLLPIAPEVAYDLVQRDLLLEPGNLTLWRLSGVVAEAQNLPDEARVAYETHLAIEPASGVGYDLAVVLIQSGADAKYLNSVLKDADRVAGGASLRSDVLRSLGELRRAKPPFSRVIPRLKKGWDQRARAKRTAMHLEIGLLYAHALLRRHADEDLVALEALLEELEPIAAKDLYAGQLVESLSGLAEELRTLAEVAELTPVD